MIEPRYATLQSLFADRVFRIPAYQRFYSWHAKQRLDLFSDLQKLSRNAIDQHHFMATIVCHKTSEVKPIGASQYRVYDVVDGQQRLTTLIILLKCIELALPEDSEDRKELAKILVKRDGHLILLQTNNANEHIFTKFIREGEAPKKADAQTQSDRTLASAIDECQNFVNDWDGKGGTLGLMQLLLHRLGFVVYDTEDSRIIYTLFEVLNSRGLAVDWLDKTKSVLMGKASELSDSPVASQASIEALQKLWSKIYEELAKEDLAGEEVLRIAATLYYGPGHGKPRPAEDSLDLLSKECKNAQIPLQISQRLLDVAKKLTFLYEKPQLNAVTDVLQSRLLAVAILLAKGIDEKERTKLLDQWERITFRTFVLFGKDSRAKVGDYVKLGWKIVKEHLDMRTYNQIMGGLRELGSDFDIETAIQVGLEGRDFYDDSPEGCRYLLWNYEEHLAQKKGKNATVDAIARAKIWSERASDSIEHIHPQTPGSGWKGKLGKGKAAKPLHPTVGRIGNLLLLPGGLNSEAKADPFKDKKELYKQHHLRMVDEVTALQDWDISKIEEREARLISWVGSRWSDI